MSIEERVSGAVAATKGAAATNVEAAAGADGEKSFFGACLRAARTLLAAGAACVLAAGGLAGCSGEASSNPSASPEPSFSFPAEPTGSANAPEPGAVATGNLADWGTWTPGEEGFGSFRSERLGFEVTLPGEPEVEEPVEGNEFETTRFRVVQDGRVAAMVTVEKVLDEQKELLAPMSVDERTSELSYYVQQMVGAAEYVENSVSMPLDGHAGIRCHASNFDADLWTVLGEDRLYTVTTYGLDEVGQIMVLGSLALVD